MNDESFVVFWARCCWMAAPSYVENGLLSGISDLSTFVPFVSAFFVAFLSFFSVFFPLSSCPCCSFPVI